MSKNVKVNGLDYYGISKVQMNAVEGGTVTFVDADEATGGGGEKILYMDAALLNAGGAYPVDADDYTTAVIPAEATFVDVEAFANLPNVDTLIVNGDCEFDVYEEAVSKSVYYYNAITKHHIPIRKLIIKDRTEIPAHFMERMGPLLEIDVCGAVGENAFDSCDFLRKIALDGVTSIGPYAFYSCDDLTEVNIPESVNSIGASAFSGCLDLTKVTMSDNVTSMGSKAFYGCTRLIEVTISEGVTSIESETFYNCSLTGITIPDSVVSIGGGAFYACTALETITILGAETTIADTSAIPSTTKIRAYTGSAAETFANENGYTFEAIA
ncbi:leucine-rich repeat domain-containing protein [Listeria monocytogenes]|nr:leucine-rich repeat domain-containing protein [Listeria monocytogenes]